MTATAVFNSRNPFASNKPDYSNRQISANFSGPINKRSSFFMDFNRRDNTDNAITNAVYVDPANPLTHPEHQHLGGRRPTPSPRWRRASITS